ncbi:MAG: mannitol dehydrogenase family protein [Polaribacter sp.]|uniref:mannitol dehydrogenase family protein n=1 Tax=Candidatus Arcticimaribacter forsetii TaxID=2820661 RepID=UPI00207782BE|nr:mannitol dehydrogenase family protein [Candidatus Arcticimaribacter forsetii]MDB2345496.1 mannitol dehydrogenase family protein [Flavobacteriaceae bacterium]MDB2457115.1 mannitol dehydrogenase family protein [Flavobacteriaceae bacterium]MDB4674854.1 mannitol dehydrogenase family protein [Flavobacteriaceae bacterium]MDB4751120.1 mannitol dehydrogenase family protein [Flavobacteriaceae bacterium]
MDLIQLNQQSIHSLEPQLGIPKYDRKSIKTGIIHVGVGGFHRSHQAYYMHQLLCDSDNSDWGICGIGLRAGDQKIAQVLKEQDGLYTLITQHPNGKEGYEVIGSIVDFIFAFETPQIAIDKMAHPDTKIVSLTITEGGYNFNPNTGDFDFENPEIQQELKNHNQPKTVFGYLTAALRKRKAKGTPAFTILSCDNIQHNGDVARKMLLSFAQKQDPTLADWIANEVCFPNSMVDRITPVTPKSAIEFLQNKYSIKDAWPIVCEPYIQWVIEDRFSNGRPPLEKLGVQFVPDVTPYEKMKIRLLNAGHSTLGIPGAVHGHATINACMEDKIIARFMREFMDQEVTPILDEVQGINLTEYKNNLEDRFSNPNIKDGVSRICSESSAKLPKFLIPTLLENLETGGSIKYATFILSVWGYYSAKEVDNKANEIEILDARKEELHHAASGFEKDSISFLRISDIFGDLLEKERFVKLYLKMSEALFNDSDIHKQIKLIFEDNYTLDLN